jgi:uncharacterized membrane protein SirB2
MTHWFKPHQYGYGATPANWRGWLAVVAFVLIIAGVALAPAALHQIAPSAGNPWLVLTWLAVNAMLVLGFIAIARAKTDGQWRWRWGK